MLEAIEYYRYEAGHDPEEDEKAEQLYNLRTALKLSQLDGTSPLLSTLFYTLIADIEERGSIDHIDPNWEAINNYLAKNEDRLPEINILSEFDVCCHCDYLGCADYQYYRADSYDNQHWICPYQCCKFPEEDNEN